MMETVLSFLAAHPGITITLALAIVAGVGTLGFGLGLHWAFEALASDDEEAA